MTRLFPRRMLRSDALAVLRCALIPNGFDLFVYFASLDDFMFYFCLATIVHDLAISD